MNLSSKQNISEKLSVYTCALLYSYVFTKLTTLAIAPVIAEKVQLNDFSIWQFVFVFLIILGLASAFFGIGSSTAKRFFLNKHHPFLFKKEFNFWFCIIIACLGLGVLLIVVQSWPAIVPSFFSISYLYWGKVPFLMDLPMYIGMAIVLPSAFKPFDSKVDDFFQLTSDALLLSICYNKEQYGSYKKKIKARLRAIIESGQVSDVGIMAQLCADPSDEIRSLMVDLLPKKAMPHLIERLRFENNNQILDKLIRRCIKNKNVVQSTIAHLASHPEPSIRLLIYEHAPDSQINIIEPRLVEEENVSALIKLAKRFRNWHVLFERYILENDSGSRSELEASIVDVCLGQLDVKQANELVNNPKAPVSLRCHALTLLNQDTVWKLIFEFPELSNAGVRLIEDQDKLVELVLLKTLPIVDRIDAIFKITEADKFTKIIFELDNSELRLEALKQATAYGDLIKIAIDCPHLDVLQWLVCNTNQEDVLKCITKRTDIGDLSTKAIEKLEAQERAKKQEYERLQKAKREKSKRQNKDKIIQQLISECKWHFDNSANYYSMENEFRRREIQIIKPLGVKLHNEGGLALMREVYEAVEKECMKKYGKGCRSALDMKWDGVGEWQG